MLHHERNQDPVFEVNPKVLYKQALRAKVAFPHWYSWAEEKISEMTQLRRDMEKTDEYRKELKDRGREGSRQRVT